MRNHKIRGPLIARFNWDRIGFTFTLLWIRGWIFGSLKAIQSPAKYLSAFEVSVIWSEIVWQKILQSAMNYFMHSIESIRCRDREERGAASQVFFLCDKPSVQYKCWLVPLTFMSCVPAVTVKRQLSSGASRFTAASVWALGELATFIR